MVLRKFAGYAIGYDYIQRKAMVSKQFPKTINTRGFHFEVAYPVVPDVKSRKPGYQVGLGEAYPQNTALRTVETGSGNCNSVLKSFNKMFNKGGRPACYVREGDMALYLGLGDECLDDLFFFIVRFVAVEVQ